MLDARIKAILKGRKFQACDRFTNQSLVFEDGGESSVEFSTRQTQDFKLGCGYLKSNDLQNKVHF